MTTFLKIVSLMAKYGSRAVSWCWSHRDEIMRWIGTGASVTVIINWIKARLGL